jgi:hypothetical protein
MVLHEFAVFSAFYFWTFVRIWSFECFQQGICPTSDRKWKIFTYSTPGNVVILRKKFNKWKGKERIRIWFKKLFPCHNLYIKIPWRRKWQPTPVLLPGKSHGQRSLVGYSPWGCKELDTTKQLYFTLLYQTNGLRHVLKSKSQPLLIDGPETAVQTSGNKPCGTRTKPRFNPGGTILSFLSTVGFASGCLLLPPGGPEIPTLNPFSFLQKRNNQTWDPRALLCSFQSYKIRFLSFKSNFYMTFFSRQNSNKTIITTNV